MFIRLLAIGGLLSIACTTYAQSYFDSYGYNASPMYDAGHHDWHGGHAHPLAYSYHHLDSYQHARDVYGYRERVLLGLGGFDCQEFANRHGYHEGNVMGCGQPYGCPLERGNPYGGPTFDRDAFSDFHQHGSDPSGHGHAHDGHDHGHAHAQPRAPFTPPGDTGRLRELPNRGRFAPPAQAPFPSDRDRLAPPSLPRGAQPGQTESPLGDGRPPPTVPRSSPRRLRTSESKSLNI